MQILELKLKDRVKITLKGTYTCIILTQKMVFTLVMFRTFRKASFAAVWVNASEALTSGVFQKQTALKRRWK